MRSADIEKRSQPQWLVSGIIACQVARVWTALIDANPILTSADKASLTGNSVPPSFSTTIGMPGAGKLTVQVDTMNHCIAVQGEWWYRGVYRVEPHERGSLVSYEVYNIAPGLGW